MDSQALKDVGLKVTLPRMKILDILHDHPELHLRAEDIYRQLINTGEATSLATVYRVLTQFEAAGLVKRHNFEGGQSVFELNQGDHPSLTPEELKGKPLQRIETDTQQHGLDAALSRAAQRADALISDIMTWPEMLSSDEMAHRLGVTRDTVNRRREAGRLLALSGAERGFRYPAWQLDQHGKPIVGLERVLTAAGDAWSAYRWLTAMHPELDHCSGLDALRKGQEHDLLALIEHRGETFA
jgi:Fe2+ or Zn2+ uptake regulation protein